MDFVTSVLCLGSFLPPDLWSYFLIYNLRELYLYSHISFKKFYFWDLDITNTVCLELFKVLSKQPEYPRLLELILWRASVGQDNTEKQINT